MLKKPTGWDNLLLVSIFYLCIIAQTGEEGPVFAAKEDSQFPSSLPGTAALRLPEDIQERQHQQIDEFFLRQIAESRVVRDRLWQPDFSSVQNYLTSLEGHRTRFRQMLGFLHVPEDRLDIGRMSLGADSGIRVEEVTVGIRDEEFMARALVFSPDSEKPTAAVIAVPPGDQTREQFVGLLTGERPAGWLQELLTANVTVAVPVMVERTFDHDLAPLSFGAKMTRRQLLHRLGFAVGRTVVGLEVQQVLAVRRFLAGDPSIDNTRIGVFGMGQGGMTAFYAAAVDTAIAGAAVVNYFERREECWKEPVDRMLYGQLKEFGDAEIAALIAPRPLAVVYAPEGPASPEGVKTEMERARRFYHGIGQPQSLTVVETDQPMLVSARWMAEILGAGSEGRSVQLGFRISADRMERTRNEHFQSLYRYLKQLCDHSEFVREKYWALSSTSLQERPIRAEGLRRGLRDLMGIVEDDGVPLNPRTSLIEVTEQFAAYDVVLDVVPGVEAWGQLLIPKTTSRPSPAVIAQHGSGGRPHSVTGIGETGDSVYHRFAAHLAEQGYVVFAPFVSVRNLPFPEAANRSEESFLALTHSTNPKVRMAATLGMMRTSIELAKLRRIIDFLQSLAFVDTDRIGYYGLSYGGYSALWMCPLEPRIKASVISGHFTDWRSKITSERIATSYLRHPDEDFTNWNVLHRFTHVELIAAMWPRTVFIEYGEGDAVTPPGWHRRAWRQLREYTRAWDAEDLVARGYFEGGHEIYGIDAFDFLDRWLRPEQPAGRDYIRRSSVPEGETSETPYITHRLDSSGQSAVRGTFHVSARSAVFVGLAFRVSRVGEPGDLIIRFGKSEGGGELGEVRIPASRVKTSSNWWHEAKPTPVRLNPAKRYFFEITAEWGWIRNGDHYLLYGTRPLGGKSILPNWPLSFKTLVQE